MRTKVIVVGAGIVGATTALSLVDSGYDVTVCEPAAPGGEQAASYGNGGWISPASIIPMSMPNLWRKVPNYLLDTSGPLAISWKHLPHLAPWLIRFLLAGTTKNRVRTTAAKLNYLLCDSPDRHTRLADRIGHPELIAQKGLAYIYPDRAAFEAEQFAWQLRGENGIVWQEWDEMELHERLPAVGESYRFAAYLIAGAHCLNTSAYVAAIVKAATDAGATLIERQVTGLSSDHSNRVVFADGDTMRADKIVVACGIHAKKLMSTIGVKIPMESERGYHATISGLDVPFDIPVMPSSGKMANTPTHLGLRLSGQVELSSVEDAPNWARSSILYKHALATYPFLKDNPDVQLQYWMGHRPSVSDGLPVIGQLCNQPGIVLAYGHGHVGIASAPKTADIVVRAVEQRTQDGDRAFSPARFGY